MKLFSIQGRMLRADLIKIWKAFNAEVEVGLGDIYERQSHSATRGHSFKISVHLCRTELRRRLFNVSCVGIWNGLPVDTVNSNSVDKLKRLLDVVLGNRFYETFDYERYRNGASMG